jgi:hypothetical protein
VDVPVQHFDVRVRLDVPLSTSPGSSATMRRVFTPSPVILNGTCFRFRMMSVASSTTPGIGLNSCGTPSIRTAVMAAPSIELSRHTPQAVADRGAEAPLEGLGREHAVTVRQRLRVGHQPLRLLKAFKHASKSSISLIKTPLVPGPPGRR